MHCLSNKIIIAPAKVETIIQLSKFIASNPCTIKKRKRNNVDDIKIESLLSKLVVSLINPYKSFQSSTKLLNKIKIDKTINKIDRILKGTIVKDKLSKV